MSAPVGPDRNPRHHYYRRSFEHHGRTVHGYLTTVLDAHSGKSRDAVLIKAFHQPVPEALRGAYAQYTGALRAMHETGAVAAAKAFLVRERGLSPQVDPLVRSVVHRFGPVPAFDLGEDLDVVVHGEVVSARKLCYADRGGPARGAGNVPVFLEALALDPERVFRRYFEDVSARMSDICVYGNPRSSAMWLKEIEAIIGGSITSKLKVIKPGSVRHDDQTYEWRKWCGDELSPDDVRRREFFVDHRELVFLVNHVRILLLHLVNRMYRILGLNDRSDDYRNRLGKDTEHFAHFFQDDVYALARARYPELEELTDGFNALQQRDEDRLYQERGSLRWVQDVVQFMRHLFHVEKTARSATRPVFFLSHHFRDERSAAMADAVERFVSEQTPVQPVRVGEDAADTMFRQNIQSAIWMSDRVVSIAVANAVDARSQRQREYKWLAAECEHGVLQAKKPVFLLDDSADLAFYERSVLGSGFDFLAPSERRSADDRRAALARQWNDTGHTFFDVAAPLDGRVQTRLLRESAAAADRRRRLLLSAYLSMFEDVHIRALVALAYALASPAGQPRARVIDLWRQHNPESAADAKDIVGNLLDYFNRNGRSMHLQGQLYYALRADGSAPASARRPGPGAQAEGAKTTRRKGRYLYHSQLPAILEALFPDDPVDRHRQILQDCLEDAVTLRPEFE